MMWNTQRRKGQSIISIYGYPQLIDIVYIDMYAEKTDQPFLYNTFTHLGKKYTSNSLKTWLTTQYELNDKAYRGIRV